jgi:hypothetical protein
MIISHVFFMAFCKAGVSYPMPDSEEFPVGTHTTENKMEYSPSRAFQQKSLPEHEQTFWQIIGFVVPSLISIITLLQSIGLAQGG